VFQWSPERHDRGRLARGRVNDRPSAVSGKEVPLSKVVDINQARGLSLTRLRRPISRARLQRRIGQVGELIQAGLPGAIEGRQGALDALREADL
jgi:hypothetical protein